MASPSTGGELQQRHLLHAQWPTAPSSATPSSRPGGGKGIAIYRRQRTPGAEQLHQRHGPLHRPRHRQVRRQRRRPQASATVTGNWVVRSGGHRFNQGQPAMHIGNGGDGQGDGDHFRGHRGLPAETPSSTRCTTASGSPPPRTSSFRTARSRRWAATASSHPASPTGPSGSAITGYTALAGLLAGMTAFDVGNSSGYTATVSGNSWRGHPASPPRDLP